MATNISSLLNMGQNALLANQAAIQVTGNNISNVNTEGYRRQEVRFEAGAALNGRPGQIGTGAYAAEVVRHFDRFIERSYLEKSSLANRWAQQYQMQLSIDGLFNESNSQGINSQLSAFFNSWQDLSNRPSSLATREALVSNSQNLAKVLRDSQDYMQTVEERINADIDTEVGQINTLIERIANLNRQINTYDEPGKNNANTLLDERDAAVRELATHIDLEVIDRGSGDYTVATTAGHTLVHKEQYFSLQSRGANTEFYANPETAKGSRFGDPGLDADGNVIPGGEIGFAGKSYHEYTVRITKAGGVGDGTEGGDAAAAQYQVSLDGGRTWVSDENGQPITFTAHNDTHADNVLGLDIYFNAGANGLVEGDSFVITPKSGVYWDSPTRGLVNISPQKFQNGLENDRRLVGGTLAGLLNFRDYQLGHYRERLDNLAENLAWEVNFLHSQGVGMGKSTLMSGTYAVQQTDAALGKSYSGLTYGDRLQSGSVSFYFYDKETGQNIGSAALDFTKLDAPPSASSTFDPSVHSLEHVAEAINKMEYTDANGNTVNPLKADIKNNKLVISINSEEVSGLEFAVGNDTSGLLAALGINTFFDGSTATDIAVRSEIIQDNTLIANGQVNGGNEGNIGDNVTARAIADLVNQKVNISAVGLDGATRSTIGEYFSSLVGLVGADTSNAKFQGQYQLTLAQDLDARQESVGGVNLDEELSSLIKFQNTYKAAAKLINTADEMFQTILGLKN